ncbi:pantoate--beta-alanine ligase [Streptomyces sp. NPDC021622]|uniref:4-phosphopantoate--beta-alanine ligase n=1 Tax=Streptomyces sp. NPDC021622 TaxID=3155013 RepID=UPI0033C7918E
MQVIDERAELLAVRAELVGPVGLVITMGALHAGHAALIEQARRRCDHVVVTVYVNPLQYEDPRTYPSTLDADRALCANLGVEVLYAPSTEQVYRDRGPLVRVDAGERGAVLEAHGRPGYFEGVLTVMLKMTNLVRPEAVFLGEKDFQQLALFRRMVFDLDVPVEVVGVPTVREADGLALSSRNLRLSPKERTAGLALPQALTAAVTAARAGTHAEGVLAAARALLTAAEYGDPPMHTLYLNLTDPLLGPAPASGPAWLLAAVRLGTTRLIDGMPLHLSSRPTKAHSSGLSARSAELRSGRA